MPGLVPGIHVLLYLAEQDVDGRDKPGHDKAVGAEAHLMSLTRNVTTVGNATNAFRGRWSNL